jgi:hypothetical protein
MMNRRFLWMAAALLVSGVDAMAAERYACFRVQSDDDGIYREVRAESVELTVDGREIHSRVRIKDASRDLSFTECSAVKADGSPFSRWFATECRKMAAADGASYTVEPFLLGAYAGISPIIGADYPLHDTLAEIGGEIGIGTPARTFVIYADRKPQYEFFCYGGEPARKP